MLLRFICFLSFLPLYSCSPESIQADAEIESLHTLSYAELVQNLPKDWLEQIVEQPSSEGALGRNKEAYFHVRFQLSMPRIMDYAIAFESSRALGEFVKSLGYAFSHQTERGDFEFVAPQELRNNPDYQAPSEGDLASGTAFFAYALGMSLQSLENSAWYKGENEIEEQRLAISNYSSRIQRMLDYLKENKDLLASIDAHAPNRLLFDGIAFYSLGKYLNDQEAIQLGLEFTDTAFMQRDEAGGYFIEGGGWDSSYNGVALKLGLEFYALLANSTESYLSPKWEAALIKAANWQSSRILASGEISSEGNTRVFPGGESFLGKEKGIDVLKSLQAFYYISILSDNPYFTTLAERIQNYYE